MIEFLSAHLMQLTGVILGLITLIFVGWTRLLPATSRQFGYAVATAAGAMAVVYLATAPLQQVLGIGEDPIRFLGYTAMWIPFVLVIGAIAGASKQLILGLLGVVLTRVWVTYFAGFLDGIAMILASLTPFVLLVVGIFLLYGPFERAANEQSPARSLLYSKLANLVVLAWMGLVANGLIAAFQLVDDFVGGVVLVYVEIILVVGFGALVLRNADALEDVSTGLLSFDEDASVPTEPAETQTTGD
ncbi:bacteriorhodopsin [Natronobacterium texcoconense]|uniref:Bacteriorhodopsin-like protein n=1 Tax=Natronobacterium texcoconense TaxID=1095778 RepID=A0A1H1J1I4_NATTX|nr:bacteriorhodopsin [Natronobacterium texcoconense]SDR43831.1 Bacteriorhodopsin-like protein [Natronobacterium texcoconense]